MKRKMRKLLSAVLAAVLLVSLLPASAMALGDGSGSAREYGNYQFTKVSNPDAGPGEPDGINTNDVTGYPANRLNSYAWAVASRGDYIYIGTNRSVFGSALNALGANMLQLVRVDEDDNAEVVYQTLGLYSSLRDCCVYGEGEEETVYFGG